MLKKSISRTQIKSAEIMAINKKKKKNLTTKLPRRQERIQRATTLQK